MKYHVVYVVDCTPTFKQFKTKEARTRFITKFVKVHPNPMDGSWIDYLIDGKFEVYDDSK